jgi:hypothetical protein
MACSGTAAFALVSRFGLEPEKKHFGVVYKALVTFAVDFRGRPLLLPK